MKKTALIGIVLLALLISLKPLFSLAQEYPQKPINLLIGYPPGGAGDIAHRLIVKKVEKVLGQAFVITSNGGGGGSVAAGIFAKQRPDGYNLLGTNITPLIRVPQLRTVPYKLDDFVPILHFGLPGAAIVVRSDTPWKTLKDLVDYAKNNPGKVTYLIFGTGTPMHFAMLFIAQKEGIQWSPLSAGDQQPLPLILGGHVSIYSAGGDFISHAKEGTLRVLATMGEKRMKGFPNVPTLRELGYDYINEAAYIVCAPKGTPLPIIKKLDEAYRKSMDDPEFVQYMGKMEFEIAYRNHEDVTKFLQDGYARIAKMIVDFKIPTETGKK